MVSSLRLLSVLIDFGWLDCIACRVAEGIALVGDHRGNIHVRQVLEWRHCRAAPAIHDDVDVAFLGPGGNLRSSDSRESPWHTLPVGLMAGGAVRVIHGFALGL